MQRLWLEFFAGKGFRELGKRVLALRVLPSERIRAAGITFFIGGLRLRRDFLLEHVRCSDRHQDNIVDDRQNHESDDDTDHNLIELCQKFQLKQIERHIEMEQRVFDIKIRAVREFEDLKPKLRHRHEGRDRAKSNRENIGGLFQLFHIGRFRRSDFGEIALAQMVQIKHHQSGYDDERRDSHRQLGHELLEKDCRIAHLFKPHEVRDEVNQP